MSLSYLWEVASYVYANVERDRARWFFRILNDEFWGAE